jgi:lipoic acid synthetase
VKNGKPRSIDPDEPSKIAEAVTRLGLRYVVVTSVTRDDIPDGGAYHFAEVIRSVNDANPETAVEVLIPDFRGSTDSLKKVLDANPTVVSHNVETVEELYGYVRPEADYRRSLDLIRNIRKINPRVHSKTGIMLGLGETFTQLLKTFDDLITVNCEILTIGQYLSPSEDHYPVKEYIHPDVFIEYGEIARKKGFDFVASSPFVRSSYQAAKAIVTFSTL